jgi:hypothetical protein
MQSGLNNNTINKSLLLAKRPLLSGRSLQGAMASFINRPPVSLGTRLLQLKQVKKFIIYNHHFNNETFSVVASEPGTSTSQSLGGPPLLNADSSSDDSGCTIIRRFKFKFILFELIHSVQVPCIICVTHKH